MKKMVSIALALILAMSLICTALADEVPQPEAGKKFETCWAAQNTVVRIDYEEEGYRVAVVNEILTEGTGTEWSPLCPHARHPEHAGAVFPDHSRTKHETPGKGFIFLLIPCCQHEKPLLSSENRGLKMG